MMTTIGIGTVLPRRRCSHVILGVTVLLSFTVTYTLFYRECLQTAGRVPESAADVAELEHTRGQSQQDHSAARTEHNRVVQIKGWKPIEVDKNVQGVLNDKSKQPLIDKITKAIEKWDLFSVNFPDEQSQDSILVHFELESTVYEDIIEYLQKYEMKKKKGNKVTTPLAKYKNKVLKLNGDDEDSSSWKRFHRRITQYRLYSPDDAVVGQVIREMQTMPLVRMYEPSRGTQQKLVFYLENRLRVVWKPMRFPRQQQTLPLHFYWTDFERHTAEIAAFHLDRALEFYRVPPVVGRNMSVRGDIQQLDTDHKLTMFTSPAGNLCFYGACHRYCDTAHAVCGRPDVIEGSFMMYTPSRIEAPRDRKRHPWRRTYDPVEKAEWQINPAYCDAVRVMSPFNAGRKLLDVMDVAVFDFLAGNMDRHHLEYFLEFGNFTVPVLYDNGRGFGKSGHDELTILAPIYQCCLIRHSTLTKLISFHKGPKHLSHVMKESLRHDLAHPVLSDAHYTAMDRRLAMVLKTVHKCIQDKGYEAVVIDDGL